MTDTYTDFHNDIKRLTKDVEYYQDQCESLKRVNDAQLETIRAYKAIVDTLDAELKKLRGDTI